MLACALEGTPVIVPGTDAEVVLACQYPLALLEVNVVAIAFTAHRRLENFPGECTRRAAVTITVQPEGIGSHSVDKTSFTASWRGAVQPLSEKIRIRLRVPALPEHSTQRCSSIDVRSITFSVLAGESLVGTRLAPPRGSQAALDPLGFGGVVAVQMQAPGAQPLYVSRFALGLCSAVLWAQLQATDFQELSLGDYPDASVLCFLQMLHTGEYTGPQLSVDELVALYALGEAYKVQGMMDVVRAEITARPLRSEDLQRTLAAASKYSGASGELWKCIHVKVRTCTRSVMLKKRSESFGAKRTTPASAWSVPGTPREGRRLSLPAVTPRRG